MNPFEMVVAIIIVVTIGKVLSTRYRAQNGIIEDQHGNEIAAQNRDSDRLQEEVKYLKERVAVLEKIATDDRGARELENEIEKLRDR
jgi:cell division protein FtsL|tara:strand:- start:1533 stop:1793 length:261 start_codon:yes stop_codon:yes gene_type:complete